MVSSSPITNHCTSFSPSRSMSDTIREILIADRCPCVVEKNYFVFPNFGKEPRNVKFGLAIDGMNSFGNLSTKHIAWSILLIIYNLPSCLLVKDLKMLWEKGIDVFDGYSNEFFRLCAMLFYTINDFSTYENLCNYSIKGHKTCPICEDDTYCHQLLNWKKTIYLGHRRFLKPNHPCQRLKKAFNGFQ
uniref:Uncharacterized protein n=1 Tax=Cajanus cajan TaxID=3821 RepID=A0A151QR42_CAJCA|nr:hypothetical protein KK1_046479 [Cajanus cajan]